MKYLFNQSHEELYLDYLNNFLTIRNFADHYNFNINYASDLIDHFRNIRTIDQDIKTVMKGIQNDN